MISLRCLVLLLSLGLGLVSARADEGMWLFNNPPAAQLQQKYNFSPTPQWLEHLQKASVRFNSGGSGSFISADGLAITNHHVGADTLQKLSSAEHNYLREGFYAKTQAEEQRALDLELNVLESVEDVTDRVNAAIKPTMNAEAALAARRAIIAQIEKESKDKTGLRSNVITLYEGGSYQLYRYKRYTDVRLVFAPEQQAAFYGGDPDNFEYPRYDLDICIFRVYEDGKPAHIDNYLKFNPAGPKEGDLVFISGNPGGTDRELTISVLTDARDRQLPARMAQLFRREVNLTSYSARSLENARRARDDLFGVQNSRKALGGRLAGLLDPMIFDLLLTNETNLRKGMKDHGQDSKFKEGLAAYDKIATAQKAIVKVSPAYDYYERQLSFHSTLADYARLLVRAPEEHNKPNGERLPEFRESSLDSLELALFSTEPIYDDLEELQLTDSLTDLIGHLGAEDPLVKQVMAGKGPADRAAELVKGTKLKDLAFRKKLYAGDSAAIKAANDPMLSLMLLIDPAARAARKTVDASNETKQQAYAQIAKVRFALKGASSSPDATFTLRLSYGTVRGYEENGKQIPAFTNLGGLYQRSTEHENKEPFELPQRWVEKKDLLSLGTNFDFVCDGDIIGGNSGSPVVNREGEFVGIIFDGNIQSLVLDYLYNDKIARAVSVDSAAISEALRKVYDASALADEIEGKTK
ncbi:MAG: S46 family peptidase [Chthoniobacterales bacterium]|nr:S46 family peptidase [Chthoniobacterales bacterium]